MITKIIHSLDKSVKNILFTQRAQNNDKLNCKYEINNSSIQLIFPKLKGYKNNLGRWITFEKIVKENIKHKSK